MRLPSLSTRSSAATANSSSPTASRPFLLGYVALVSFVIPGILALAITGLTVNRRAGRAAQLTAIGLLAAIVASERSEGASLPGWSTSAWR